MDAVLQFLQTNFPAIIEYKYLFLFLGAMVEGLNTMVLGGFLVSVNTIKLLPIFLLFILAYTINGYIWYTVGYFAGAKPIDKWGRKDRKGRKIIEKVEEYFNKYSGRAIIVTKFTFSLTIATLIMAGSLKYNLKKFSFYNFIGSVGWVVVTLFVGYFFGQSYKLFFVYLKNFTYGLVFLGGAIALIYIIKLILGSAFVKSLFITDKIKELSDKLRNGLEEFLSNGNGSKEE